MYRNHYKRRKKKRILLKLTLSLVLLAGICFWQYNNYIYNSVDENDDTNISFQIKQGTPIKEIAANLKEKELIKSDTAFYLHTKFNNLGENILAGRFLLNKGMNIPEIIEGISDPSQAEAIITIQEGLRIRDIDQKLVDMGIIESGEFIEATKNFNGWEYYSFLDQKSLEKLETPLEGYIYPDTYFLDSIEFNPSDLIYLSLDNFERKIADIDIDEEIIIMASIIENEVFGIEDRRIVSGILWKRLESGWTIGADATLLYITDDRTITSADLEIDSPYNTRKNGGLPPGPISSPSIESIEAAANPTKSEYWFYLTTLDTGEVIYAKSNEEHNQNKVKYL